MKRTIAVILCMIFSLFLLTSCGKLSEENIDCAKSVLEAADFYLDGKIASGTAVSALELYKNSVVSEGKKSTELRELITDLSNSLLYSIETSDTSEMLTARNNLAEFIGDPLK